MGIRPILLLVLAGAFGALAAYSAVLAQREYIAVRTGTTWGVSEFQDFSGDEFAPSHRANQDWIDGCLRAITSIEGRLLYGVKRDLLIENCTYVASEIVKASPRNAFAWYFLAYLSLQIEDDDKFNSALTESYKFSPTEQWLAELRVPLAEQGLDALNELALKGHRNDLGLLVQSRRGIGSIARRYVRDPDFRNRITDVVETLPQDAQKRFLQTLKGEVARFQSEE